MAFPGNYSVAIVRYEGWTTGTIYPFKVYTMDLSNWGPTDQIPWGISYNLGFGFRQELGVKKYRKFWIHNYY
jgi:hypothetical protein